MNTCFELEVTKVWKIADDVVHIIGILRSGKVIPPCFAVLKGGQGQSFQIESVVIAKSVSGDPREITLSIKNPTFDHRQMEGQILCGQQKCD
jgi:hypothetical protein